MATVTGHDSGIDTSRLGWMVPTRKLKIVEVTPEALTVGVAAPSYGGDGYGIRYYGGECTFYGSFEGTKAKALSLGTVTSIESIWKWSPGQAGPVPLISIDGLDLTFGAIQKGDFPLILAGDDTITCSPLADYLFGHAGDDVIDGREGDDQLDGGTGADLMRGGSGNDIYMVDDPGARVVERAGEGQDTVQSSVSFTLPEHVEELWLGGAAEAGVGNALANDISGNRLANRLEGLAGDDRLDGGPGADTMLGGPGNDSYVVDDLRDLAGGYEPGVSLVGDFLRLAVGRKATKVSLDPDGSEGAARFQVLAVLTGFDGTGVSVESLVDEGSILLA